MAGRRLHGTACQRPMPHEAGTNGWSRVTEEELRGSLLLREKGCSLRLTLCSETIAIATVGASITAGHGLSTASHAWPAVLQRYLTAAWPTANVTVHDVSVPATSAGYAALCLNSLLRGHGRIDLRAPTTPNALCAHAHCQAASCAVRSAHRVQPHYGARISHAHADQRCSIAWHRRRDCGLLPSGDGERMAQVHRAKWCMQRITTCRDTHTAAIYVPICRSWCDGRQQPSVACKTGPSVTATA